MARRYTRDNRGRFASVGATARGGRLRTAAGNKRERVTASPGAADRLSSAPKGTVGKTSAARFSQHVDRPFSKRGAHKERYQAQKAEIAQRKKPKEMSLEEFARVTGGKTRADSMGLAIEQSRQPRGRTKAGDRRNEARLREVQNQVRTTNKAYDAAVKSGKIKAPTTSLARKAQGHPDNPATQAAQRLLAKTAAKRAAAAKPADRKSQLQQGAQKRTAQANRIDAKVASLEKQYRSKDSAFYTQGVKTAERDKMHGKMRQAAALRQESAALRQKAANAARMAARIKDKPAVPISSDRRVARAQAVEARASQRPTSWKRRMTGATARRAQQFYSDPMGKGMDSVNMLRKGWKLPRQFRKTK